MKLSYNYLYCLLGVSLFGILAGPAAQAIVAGDEVLIDFGLTDHQSPANWNNVANGGTSWSNSSFTAVADLTEFDSGSATGVSLTVTPSGLGSGISGSATDASPAVAPFVYTATRDVAYIGAGSVVVTFTFSGLNDALLYDFSFFSSISSASNGRLTEFTIGGDTQQVDAFENATPVTFSNIASTGGTIDIEWSTGGSTNVAILNAMQVTAIPEPSTAALLIGIAMGALVLVRVRRRS